MLQISLQQEYIGSFWGILISNSFFTSVVVSLFLIFLSLLFYIARNSSLQDTLFFKTFKVFVLELLRLTDSVTQDRIFSKKIFPLIATFFIFIITANLFTLLPGFLGAFYVDTTIGQLALFRSPNSDLTTTVALALISVGAIQFFSWRRLGFIGYIKRFINLKSPIEFIMGFFEMLSEGVKILSFSFRLFGNLFAGEVVLLIIAFLLPYIVPVPFMILEVFVGVIQAFIFAMLTLTFIKTSIIKKTN